MTAIPTPTATATESFSQWFARLGLRHFKADELAWMFQRVNKGVRNSEPPRELWKNIVPTLRVLDDLRAHVGKSVTLTSGYRSIPYNRSVGSPDTSLHTSFRALDFKVADHTPAQVFAILDSWRKSGRITGGLGKYSSFVHFDTRGRNATW